MRVFGKRFWRETEAQDLVEYALTAGLIAVVAMACMPTMGATMNLVYSKIASLIQSNVS